MEGAWKNKTGHLISLSVQQLVDCAHKGHNGCNGGAMTMAFHHIINHGGIEAQEDYPNNPKDKYGHCKFDKHKVVATFSDYIHVEKGSESALKTAVATVGPISIGIDATHFHHYISGVFDPPVCSSTDLDHGVLVVGYGHEKGKDYWLVKNSWGAHWGIGGYVKMVRNKDNTCGVATSAAYIVA